MCIGCAEAVLMSGDAKAPDTAETALYLAGFVVWIFLLTHFGRSDSADGDN